MLTSVKKRLGEDFSFRVYSKKKKSMQALRYGLQKHFLNLRDVDIVKGKEFSKSGKIFKTESVINQLKQKGKASVKHHKPGSKNDMKLIQNSFDLDDPQGLQHVRSSYS